MSFDLLAHHQWSVVGQAEMSTVLWQPDVLADGQDRGTSRVTVALVLNQTWALGPCFRIGVQLAPLLPAYCNGMF